MYIRNVAHRLLGHGLETTLGLLIASVTVRFFGIETTGRLGLIMAAVGIFTIFLNFGTDDVFIRNVSQKHDISREFSTLVVIRLGGVLAFILAFVVFFTLYQETQKPDEVLLTITAAGYFLLVSSYETLNLIFLATQKYVLVSLPRLIGKFIKLVLLIVGAVISPTIFTLAFLAIAELIAQIITCMRLLQRWHLHIYKPRWNSIKSYVLFTLPFAFTHVTGTLFQHIDKIAVGYFIDAKAVGILLAAVALYNPFDVIIKSVTNTMLPKVSHDLIASADHINQKFRGLVEFSTLLAGWLAIQLFVFVDPVVRIVYGAENLAVADVSKFFIIVILGKLWLRPYISLLVALGKHHGYQYMTSILSPLVTLMLYLVLIPQSIGGVQLAGLGVLAIPLASGARWFFVGAPAVLYALRKHMPTLNLQFWSSIITLVTVGGVIVITDHLTAFHAQKPYIGKLLISILVSNGLYVLISYFRGFIDRPRLLMLKTELTGIYRSMWKEIWET